MEALHGVRGQIYKFIYLSFKCAKLKHCKYVAEYSFVAAIFKYASTKDSLILCQGN